MGTDVVLVALNARYAHAALGLKYLYANLPDSLRPRAEILEFTLTQNPRDIAEQILARKPKIVGIGVYIWNTQLAAQLVSLLKRTSPQT